MTPTLPAAEGVDNFLRPVWATDYSHPTQGGVFAGLFTEGESWRFWVQTRDDAGAWSELVSSTCRVARAEFSEHRRITTVEIVCTGAMQSSPLAGVWSTGSHGVSRMSAFTSNDPELYIAHSPTPGTFTLPLGTEGPAQYKIERFGDAWCRSDSISALYGYSYRSLCVDAAEPVSGEFLDHDRPTRFFVER